MLFSNSFVFIGVCFCAMSAMICPFTSLCCGAFVSAFVGCVLVLVGVLLRWVLSVDYDMFWGLF